MMTTPNYVIQIFDPIFTYKRSATCTGGWKGLGSFLKITNALYDELEPEPPYLHQTYYYRYCNNIALLLERDDIFYCQIITDGKPGRIYNVMQEMGELREVFESCGDDLTVLENDRGFAFMPKFDIVLTFIESIAKARKISNEHKERIRWYAKKLNEFNQTCEQLDAETAKSTYKDALTVANQFYFLLDNIAGDICSQALAPSRKCPIDDGGDVCRTFGLFVYALKLGLNKGRFLRRHKDMLIAPFNAALKEMHQFMEIHPNIVDEYCEYMSLQKNERETLRALLEQEGFYSESWGYIGDVLFN